MIYRYKDWLGIYITIQNIIKMIQLTPVLFRHENIESYEWTLKSYVGVCVSAKMSLLSKWYVLAGTYKTQELPCHCGPGAHMFQVHSR